MISARERGTARDAIAKFSNLEKDGGQPNTNKFGARSSVQFRGSTSDVIDKFSNRTASVDDGVMTTNDNMSKTMELKAVGRRGSARDTIARFNQVAQLNQQKLDKNPFSETYSIQHFDKNATDYGRPTRGSKTEARGIRAGDYIMREVMFLCEIIDQNASGEHPNRIIKFGPLFYTYAHYSDKVVGMLIRARKYKLVDFEGEMLYQGQDDNKIIRMLMPLEEIRKVCTPSGDPKNCIAVTK